MNYVTFTRRTEDPKLRYLEHMLDERGIPHRRNGASFHAPILEVEESKHEEAWELLGIEVPGKGRFDDIPDDDEMFGGAS